METNKIKQKPQTKEVKKINKKKKKTITVYSNKQILQRTYVQLLKRALVTGVWMEWVMASGK